MAPPLDPIASLRAALRGHYDIEREIGQGAFATVYLARDLKHERKVAIKVLHADPSSEMGELRFIREIRVLARLQHPNILPLHDSGHVEALLYYVMPYVAGETLRDRISRERQLSVNVACNIARDAADALAYAHGQGIIHRDIKPENILLSAGHPILADFGIARVIGLAGVRQLTRPGMDSPGTPAYMSPEQLLGDKELDGRSDTYSLGCVLFEMITGKPPFAGKEGFVKRFTEDPPRPSEFRPEVPGWMDRTVMTALARIPKDRFPTAQEFAADLTRSGGPFSPGDRALEPFSIKEPHESETAAHANLDATHFQPITAGEPIAGRLRSLQKVAPGILPKILRGGSDVIGLIGRRRAALLAFAILIAASVLAVKVAPPKMRSVFGGVAPVDTGRFIVLPFVAANKTANENAVQATEAIYDAFSHWSGLPLVTDTRVAQVIAERRKPPATEAEALALARAMGAGKLVWGNVTDASMPGRVRVHLYDVSTGETKDDFYLADVGDDASRNSNAVIRLLDPNRPAVAKGGDRLTHSYPAWSSYGRAHSALKQWNLDEAEREFRQSIGADQDYAPPRVWLAQILAWRIPPSNGEWRDQAARAATGAGSLASRERSLSAALSALAAFKYPEACQAYNEMVRSDPRDFVGMFGMGACREFDSTVVPAPWSPSKWRFRSSYAEAANAYIQAMSIDPGGHRILAFDRLQHLLPTAPHQIRIGTGRERQLFAAFPGLFNDTVGFIPYPVEKFSALADRVTSARRYAAMDHDSDVLLGFVTDWTQRVPDNPDAFEALAEILETRGDLSDGTPGRMSALGAIHRARSLAQTPEQKLRVRAREVGLHFKRSEFSLARALADSVLRESSDTDETNLRLLSGLSAMTGNIEKTTELVLRTDAYVPPTNISIPTPVGHAAAAFFTNAAMGVCGSYLQAAEDRLDRAIASNVAEEDRLRIQTDLKQRPVSLIASCDGARSSLQFHAPQDPILQMQQDLARNDLRALKRRLQDVERQSRMERPAAFSWDYVYQLSWLRAASGDTAGAIKQLDVALGALPSSSSMWIRDVPIASAAVRAMGLRADLAAAQHDSRTAQHWGRSVTALWQGAGVPLQPFVSRMQSMALAPNR
jgi:tRNA A-37 threonylcarbamoyl transferase component Bud32/tetratricopeptide (TPR) repeat protein